MMFSEDGLKIAKFKRPNINQSSGEREEGYFAEMTDWELPIQTKDIAPKELSTRTKFEANDIIRFVTKDKRDILYRLNQNQNQAEYLGEC